MKKVVNKKTFWLLLAVAFAIVYFLTYQEDITVVESSPDIGVKVEIEELSLDESKINTPVNRPSKKIPNSYLQCKQFTEDHYKITRKWQDSMQDNANTWLAEGYSPEEIAYAIEHFRNINFAQDWLVEHLLRNSRLKKENQALTEQLLSFLGSESSLPISVEKKYPIKSLVGYQDMNEVEREEAIAEEAPTVDDIAAFIKSKELDEKGLLELLDHVEQPSEIMASVGSRAPIYMLEYSIATRMYGVTEALLQLGVEPMSNGYLRNALEIALHSLDADLRNSRDVSVHIPIIKKLAAYNLSARHHIIDNGGIEPWSNLLYYRFDSEAIIRLVEEYDLDLISLGRPLQNKHPLSGKELLSNLDKKKHEYLTSKYDNFPYEESLQNCKTLNENILKVWTPPLNIYYTSEGRKLEERYAKEPSFVRAELALRDPDFIDCIQGIKYNERIGAEGRGELGKAYFANSPYSRDWIVNFLQSREFSEDELSWIFYTSLVTDKMKDVKQLIELSVVPTYLDYRKFNWRSIKPSEITYLDSNGVDTKSVDWDGKTLLYYAVKQRRIDLVKFMLAENYPFHGDDVSQDPLHVLLASWKNNYSPEAVLEMLPLIMAFKPEIDSFHLARMKLLVLRDNELYLKIVEQFPDLVPDGQTLYPEAACI